MMDLTSQPPSIAPRPQAIACHQTALRDVPHHEQEDSSLPINCRQRGQSMARCVIAVTSSIYCFAEYSIRWQVIQRVNRLFACNSNFTLIRRKAFFLSGRIILQTNSLFSASVNKIWSFFLAGYNSPLGFTSGDTRSGSRTLGGFMIRDQLPGITRESRRKKNGTGKS